MYRIVTIVDTTPAIFDSFSNYCYLCSMEIQQIMAVIEAKRLNLHKHKATVCSQAGISTTYYNRLLEGAANPSLLVLIDLLDAVGMHLILIDGVSMRI